MGLVRLRPTAPVIFDSVAGPGAIRGHEVSITLSAGAGEVVALEAPELLCNFLTDLLHGRRAPCGGEIYLLGRPLSTFTKQELGVLHRTDVATMRGLPVVDGSLTIREGLCQVLMLKGASASSARESVRTLLGSSRLGEVSDRFPADLVPSQLRWLSLLQAVVGRPQIMLVESEACGSDADEAARLIAFMREVAVDTGCSVLWLTTWIRGACLADRMFVYHRGECVDADES